MEAKIDTLCLFLVSGRTFTFKNCDNFIDNETTISFDYVAMSDSRKKHGVFSKQNLAGYSII